MWKVNLLLGNINPMQHVIGRLKRCRFELDVFHLQILEEHQQLDEKMSPEVDIAQLKVKQLLAKTDFKFSSRLNSYRHAGAATRILMYSMLY